jgi:hypothetical protein
MTNLKIGLVVDLSSLFFIAVRIPQGKEVDLVILWLWLRILEGLGMVI